MELGVVNRQDYRRGARAGLQPGEQVVTADRTSLGEGMRVRGPGQPGSEWRAWPELAGDAHGAAPLAAAAVLAPLGGARCASLAAGRAVPGDRLPRDGDISVDSWATGRPSA